MNRIFALIFILFYACSVVDKPEEAGQEIESLNGYWKFNTFLGDGANSVDIFPQDKDIILDDTQQDLIEVNGVWKKMTDPQRGSVCWNGRYLQHWYFTKEDSSNVRFKISKAIPHTGYYHCFIFFPWGHHNAAIVNVKHSHGMFSWPFNQRTRTGRWLSLGIFKLNKEKNHYIEFTSHTKGMVVADAVMLRPVDEQKYLASEKEKMSVPQLSYDDSDWDILKVPGHYGMINKYSNYSGKAWYRRLFQVPDSWQKRKDERIRLRFEGVYHVANVYLNGQYLGRHQGGFTPFEFDVTEILNYSGNNVLAVETNNEFTVGATWNWGGIIRDVTLIKNKDVRVKWQYIHAEPDLKKGSAEYYLKVRIENNAKIHRTLYVQAQIEKDGPLTRTDTTITVAPESIQEIDLTGTLNANQVKLWHFDQPELYFVETTIKEGNNVLHRKKDRFGIRKFEANDSQMFLNGEPVRLVGFNRISDHRYWGSSEPEAILKLDVDLMKRAGANFMRIMHGTQNKKLLELCDEKGILIFEEANIRDLRNPQFVPPDYSIAKQWIKEMIERDINHPCIVGWSTGNELVDHFQYVKTTYEYAKKLDPYRMALHVSNQGYKKGESRENNPLAYGDMIFQNIYQEDPGKVLDTIRARWPEKAIFVSEFGWAHLSRFTNESLDNDFEELGKWYDFIRGKRLYVTGASRWSFNDYRSGYVQSLPSENRAWGIVNAWRTKRRSFYTHILEHSPVKNFQIKNIDSTTRKAVISFEIRNPDDLPCYILRDYFLKLSFRDRTGKLLSQSNFSLPVLKPGDGYFEKSVAWQKIKGNVFEMRAELVTPNGYTRAEYKHQFGVPVQPKIDEVKSSDHKIRVHFTRQFDAFEYYIKYSFDGQEMKSYKTIGYYVDLDSLPKGKEIKLELIAVNKRGESKPSVSFTATTNGKLLAPIIQDAFIADNKLVVGYTGDWIDEEYTIRFGPSMKELNNTVTSRARGMMTVPLNGENEVWFQIKRKTKIGDSQWSPVLKAKEGVFRIYE